MRIRLPRRARRLTAKLVTAKTLLALPYALYRDETDCDSDDWGRPRGRFATLDEAMAAADCPVAAYWTADKFCPDETFICGEHYWSILGPGAAAEMRARQGVPAADLFPEARPAWLYDRRCCDAWTPADGCPGHTGRLAMSLSARELG